MGDRALEIVVPVRGTATNIVLTSEESSHAICISSRQGAPLRAVCVRLVEREPCGGSANGSRGNSIRGGVPCNHVEARWAKDIR
jgi:hypothetical protein